MLDKCCGKCTALQFFYNFNVFKVFIICLIDTIYVDFVRTGFDRFVCYSCTACLSCTGCLVPLDVILILNLTFSLYHSPLNSIWSNFLLYSAIPCKLFSKRKKTEQKENVFNLPQTCWFSALQLHVCTLVSDATLLFFLQYVHEYIFIIRQIIALTSEDANDQNMLQSLA